MSHPTKVLLCFLKGFVLVYRLVFSPLIPPRCRYHPTCSSYALEALDSYGPFRGLWISCRRFLRCRPGGGFGYDPVPELSGKRVSRE